LKNLRTNSEHLTWKVTRKIENFKEMTLDADKQREKRKKTKGCKRKTIEKPAFHTEMEMIL